MGLSASAFALSTLPWPPLCAWLVALFCLALGARRRRALESLRPPQSEGLLRELVGERALQPFPEATRRAAIAELNQQLADISFELSLLPVTYTALTRISLASGTGFGLLAFLVTGDQPPLARALQLGLAVGGGLCGAAGALAIGRSANARSAQIREAWDRSSREIGKELGTQLAAESG